MNKLVTAMALFIAIGFALTIPADEGTESLKDGVKFTDVQKQTLEFIGYYKSIQLTPEQEKIKTDALSSMPAVCCKEFTQATCCCPCNQSKSIWGLTNYLIAKKNFNEDQVKQAVSDWAKFIHPTPPAGDSCSSRRCVKSFADDGCGGMKDDQVVF